MEVALREILEDAGRRIKFMVTVCNSLEFDCASEAKFDLVIDNPPYGKVTLTQAQRTRFRESVFGHANLYGLFKDLSVNLVKENGLIGFLTPTSFLSGEYFKNLRTFMRIDSSFSLGT